MGALTAVGVVHSAGDSLAVHRARERVVVRRLHPLAFVAERLPVRVLGVVVTLLAPEGAALCEGGRGTGGRGQAACVARRHEEEGEERACSRLNQRQGCPPPPLRSEPTSGPTSLPPGAAYGMLHVAHGTTCLRAVARINQSA